MNNQCEESRAVLAALVVKMRESSDIFTARDIGYSLNGTEQYAAVSAPGGGRDD